VPRLLHRSGDYRISKARRHASIGHFIEQGNSVTLTDENGKPLDEKEGTAKVGDANPKSIASIMVRQRWEGSRGGDFNRRILYPKSAWS
jgi:hypothetical protein